MDKNNFATADLIDIAPDTPSCETQFRSFGKRSCFSGKIRTVKCERDNGLVKQLMNTPSDGEVVVIDGSGSLYSALMGDMIAAAGAKNGWAGAVIYGAIRDNEAMNGMDFGVKALGTNPRKSAKDGAGSVDIPVSFGGVTFTPGHYLYSDSDGILVSEQPLINE
ncbi:ribonuclease E activity regulator RraA [Neisseria weaveri]|uniref:ribonuclease E activity regulator RraA n=1 Tax=Neisseria weaveri TaxID=28091 RepID=UPI0007C9A8E8|nr:ribonuclease E activity regulator RraA [Neisseria weaveri]SAY50347.1 Putative regulator of ribonuclease activity [Neisseria weaveri]